MGTDPGSDGHRGLPPWVNALPLLGMALGPEGFVAGEVAEELIAGAEAVEAVEAAAAEAGVAAPEIEYTDRVLDRAIEAADKS